MYTDTCDSDTGLILIISGSHRNNRLQEREFRWLLNCQMFTDQLLHPDHIIPVVEFVTAFMELTYKTISHMSVKFHTVFVKMFIFLWRIGNAGIHINDTATTEIYTLSLHDARPILFKIPCSRKAVSRAS